MSDAEILVEIQASASVVLRGSTRGVVLEDGRSFSDFAVTDINAFLELGRFGTVASAPDVSLEVDYDAIFSLDDTYALAGKPVKVFIGQGRDPADYAKPSVGSRRARVWSYHGFVANNWRPTLRQRRRSCLLPLKSALAYRSHPALTDHIDRRTYPRAFEHNKPFPLLFGFHVNSPPGSPIFPMDRIDQQTTGTRRGTWAMGNLPLATDDSYSGLTASPFEDVIASPFDTNGLDGTKNNAAAQFSNVRDADGRTYNVNRTAWYIGSGIGATAARPLPDRSAGELLSTLGEVLYWLLRYKAGIPAAQLHHATIYGDDAPAQIVDGACYYMVRRPEETARLAEQIGEEALAPLRWVDGNRLGAGVTPRWTLAHAYINSELYWNDESSLLVDPGWLLPDRHGQPRFDNLGAHPLYANSVDIEYGVWPAVSNLPSRSSYLQTSIENAADTAARGPQHLNLRHRWNNDPSLILGGNSGVGLADADRWGNWQRQPWEWEFALRLPMGDVLPGDVLNFGQLSQDPDDALYRFVYLVESTRLDWRNRRLICRGPSIRVGRA